MNGTQGKLFDEKNNQEKNNLFIEANRRGN